MPVVVPVMDDSEAFVREKYPFIDASIILIPNVLVNLYLYDQTSCSILSRLCNAGMNTVDMLVKSSDMQSVSNQRLLGNLWQMFQGAWQSFSRMAMQTTGTTSITVTSSALDTLGTFSGWDPVLQPNPFSDIASSFYAVIKGVTA